MCAVLLAGGRGTRFWPRSRMRTPKQLLNITGKQTMLRQTAARLSPLVAPRNIWVVTNVEQVAAVRRELPVIPEAHILAEPVGRNTAAAIALTAIDLKHQHGDALMAVLAAYIADTARYRMLVAAALEMARTPGRLVVLGIPPTRPETGYGYIERGEASGKPRGIAAFEVRRFAEKPAPELAREYVASGKYFWNAGMFFWRVSTYLDDLRRLLPATYDALSALGGLIGKPAFSRALRRIYPALQNISVDYAVMEPATQSAGAARVSVIPAQWAGAISARGPRSMNCSRRKAAAMSPRVPLSRLTRTVIIFGALKSLWLPSASATSCSLKPTTQFFSAHASARRMSAKL